MLIKYLGIFLLCFLLFSCGTPPEGWEGAEFSSVDDGGGDDGGDDPPPAETHLFLVDDETMSENYIYYIYTISTQTGWCYDPNDGTATGNSIELTMQVSGLTYEYIYTFDGGTVSNGVLSGSYTYEYDINGYVGNGQSDYELRFNSDFSSATFYYYQGDWTDSHWGDIPSSGSCE